MVYSLAMDALTEEVRYRFTVEEVLAMVRSGIIDEDDRVELIEGELLVMSPNDPPHAGPIGEMNMRLARTYPAHTVRVQLDLYLSEHTLAEPDFVVARGAPAEYQLRHPRGADCLLVVEVSWSSKARDLRKVGLYAKAGVALYWILDVAKRQLEVREGPLATGDYVHTRIYGEDEEVALPEAAGRWKVAELLPPAR